MRHLQNKEFVTVHFIAFFLLLVCPGSSWAQQQSIASNTPAKNERVINSKKTEETGQAKEDNKTKDQATPSATPVPATQGLFDSLNLLVDLGGQVRSVSG